MRPNTPNLVLPIGALVIVVIQAVVIVSQSSENARLGSQLVASSEAVNNLLQADQRLKQASDQLSLADDKLRTACTPTDGSCHRVGDLLICDNSPEILR